jgi:hypothetical protein
MASKMVTLARHAASTALNGAALVLAGTAKVVEVAAHQVRPRPGAPTAPARTTAGEAPPRFEPTVVGPAPSEPPPAPERSPVMRPDASRVEELAERPAAQIIDQIDDLSTEELRLLLDHEQAHKRRKTVLRAIESAAAEHARP